MLTFEILGAVDGDWGEVHDHVLQDAVTQARWELKSLGAAVALRNIPALKDVIASGSWRAEVAADIMATILRIALAENIITVEEVTVPQV